MTYLDTSALVSLVLVDGHSETVLRWLDRTRSPLAISTFACAEFAAVLGRSVRMGALSSADADETLATFDAWLPAHARLTEVEPEDHRLAAILVRRYELGLRAPDALHVAMCRRLELPMLTFDALQAAAARQLGVAVSA